MSQAKRDRERLRYERKAQKRDENKGLTWEEKARIREAEHGPEVGRFEHDNGFSERR
jgi:hypothetical protein